MEARVFSALCLSLASDGSRALHQEHEKQEVDREPDRGNIQLARLLIRWSLSRTFGTNPGGPTNVYLNRCTSR